MDMDHTPQQPLAQETVYTPPVRTYRTAEIVFAWLSVALGYVFCRAFPVSVHPLGGFLAVLALFAVTAIMLAKTGAPFGTAAIVTALSALVMSAALVLSADPLLHTLSFLYIVAAYFVFVYFAHGNGRCGFSERCVIEFCKALLMPFYALGSLPAALSSHRVKSGGRVVARILGGFAIAIVPTLIVVGLLSYDEAFSGMIRELLSFRFENVLSQLFSIGFGVVVGIAIFSAFVASQEHRGEELLDEETCRKAASATRFVSGVTVAAAVTPLLGVYGVFFFSQWPYYVSGFTGVLPDGFSYASYAREGFFQLCTVALINFAVILASALFMKRRDERPPVGLRILTLLVSLCTLVLISTAVAKMVLYIDAYGLTQKRVYATWLMVVLGVLFVLATIKMFLPRARAILLGVLVTSACLAVLALGNVNGVIASYNVERYLDGSLETVDVEALESLGDAAIPSLVTLREALEEANDGRVGLWPPADRLMYQQTTAALDAYARRAEDRTVLDMTLPAWQAQKAME